MSLCQKDCLSPPYFTHLSLCFWQSVPSGKQTWFRMKLQNMCLAVSALPQAIESLSLQTNIISTVGYSQLWKMINRTSLTLLSLIVGGTVFSIQFPGRWGFNNNKKKDGAGDETMHLSIRATNPQHCLPVSLIFHFETAWKRVPHFCLLRKYFVSAGALSKVFLFK